MKRLDFSVRLGVLALLGQDPALADCPSLNMSKGFDSVARMLLSNSTLLFLGTIKSQRFVSDISRLADLDSDAADVEGHGKPATPEEVVALARAGM